MVAVELTFWVISMLHAILVRDQYRAAMMGGPAVNLPAPPDGRFDLTNSSSQGAGPGCGRGTRGSAGDGGGPGGRGTAHRRPAVRAKVDALASTAQRILFELRDEPRRLSLARGFLTYYLTRPSASSPGTPTSPAGTLPSGGRRRSGARRRDLDTLQRAFDRELVTLAQTDLIDLDAEISLLETTARSESV